MRPIGAAGGQRWLASGPGHPARRHRRRRRHAARRPRPPRGRRAAADRRQARAHEPGGSVKDRIALPMIEAAERAGLLKPGGVIVEPTSGNTGVGLGPGGRGEGLSVHLRDGRQAVGGEAALLRAYGAEVVVCPTDVDPDDERSYYRVSDRLARETPGAWKPDQYANPANPRRTTPPPGRRSGRPPRARHALRRRPRHRRHGLRGRPLPQGAPGVVVIVGADPAGSVYSGDTPRPYLTEGIGEDFWPTTYDTGSATSSCGSPIATRCSPPGRHRARGDPDGRVVGHRAVGRAAGGARGRRSRRAVRRPLPDSGRNYVGKLYTDDWLREKGPARRRTRRWATTTGAPRGPRSCCAATRSRGPT